MMIQSKEEILTEFRKEFWLAFHRPRLKTDKFMQLWESLETLNSIVAGPLFSVYEKGECDYVFQDKTRFPGVDDADDLLTWLSDSVQQYKDTIQKEEVNGDAEKEDQLVLLYQSDVKMELAEKCYQLYR